MNLKSKVRSLLRKLLVRGQRESTDFFAIHESVVDGCFDQFSAGVAVGAIPDDLNNRLKELLTTLPRIDMRERMSETDNEYLLLSTLSPAAINEFVDYYSGWELPHLDDTVVSLQRSIISIFAGFFVSPISIVNSRAWVTYGNLQQGPFGWHTDGFRPGHAKIMIYPLGLSENSGGIEIGKKYFNLAEPGTAIAFSNSDIRHRATPSREGGARLAVELTIQRTLRYQLQRFPSHFNGRHLKNGSLFYGCCDFCE